MYRNLDEKSIIIRLLRYILKLADLSLERIRFVAVIHCFIKYVETGRAEIKRERFTTKYHK